LLFPDTFTNYHEPEIGLATVEILHRLDCQVVLEAPSEAKAPTLCCCGRPLISNGLLTQAVRHAQHNVERLHTWALSGRPIIACEPSCLLTIKDDYPALLRGELRAKAEKVAAARQTWEDSLEALLAGKPAGGAPNHPVRSGPC